MSPRDLLADRAHAPPASRTPSSLPRTPRRGGRGRRRQLGARPRRGPGDLRGRAAQPRPRAERVPAVLSPRHERGVALVHELVDHRTRRGLSGRHADPLHLGGPRLVRRGSGPTGRRWLTMEADGTLDGPAGRSCRGPRPDPRWPGARPTCSGAGAPVAAFFRFLVDCPSLRWFQSPAAGYDSRAVPRPGRPRRAGVQRPREQPAHRRVRAPGRARRVPGGGRVAPPGRRRRVADPRLAGGGRAPPGWSSGWATSAAPWRCGPGHWGPP